MSLIGKSIIRKEDPILIKGRGLFTDDFNLNDVTFAKFVLSEHPHANLKSIDISKANKLDGVIGIFTIHDFNEYPDLPGPDDMQRPVLARNKVVYVGEPIACIVAKTQAIAEDALSLVEINYEPLKIMTSIDDALEQDADAILSSLDSNVTHHVPMLDDLERELNKPHFRHKLKIYNNRCAPCPIEPMSCLADWNDEKLLLYASTQAPHHLRNTLSKWLNIQQNLPRIIAPEVGGGFGSKIVWYPELFFCLLYTSDAADD